MAGGELRLSRILGRSDACLRDFQGCNHYFLFCARVCGSSTFTEYLALPSPKLQLQLSQAHCQRLHNTRVLYCALLLPRSRRYHSILFTSTLKAAALGFGFIGTSSITAHSRQLKYSFESPLPKICPLTTRLELTNFPSTTNPSDTLSSIQIDSVVANPSSQ